LCCCMRARHGSLKGNSMEKPSNTEIDQTMRSTHSFDNIYCMPWFLFDSDVQDGCIDASDRVETRNQFDRTSQQPNNTKRS
jgi:hypothetical protein